MIPRTFPYQADSIDFYTFSCEYETPEVTRKLNLYFYPRDNSLELYDLGMQRQFLKRTVTEVTLNDIYIGAKLLIFNKAITVKGYGNFQTSSRMGKMKQRYHEMSLNLFFFNIPNILTEPF